MAKKILLVEDEMLIRDMYNLVLKQNGYEVVSAEDGEDALAKLLEGQPDYDLILLDIMLPKLDGISVLKKVKDPSSPARSIPVFLLTNLGLDDLIKEALAIGAEQYFIKSNILPQNIVDEINAFFASREEK